MNQTIEELNKKELERCYVVVYFVKNKITFTNGTKNVYILYGMNIEGKRNYIASVIDNGDKKTSEWYDFLQVLKRRKMDSIIYAVIPSNKALSDAIKLSYMDAEIIDSMEDDIYKLKKFVSIKKEYELQKGLRSLYIARDEEEYTINLDKFKEVFVETEFMEDLIGEKLSLIKKYYSLNKEIRTLIFGFYYSSMLYRKLKSKSKKIYNDFNDYISDKIAVFNSAESQMGYTRKEWGVILNSVYLLKKEILIKYM